MIPVILSGGSGTRLWPVSRENYPKQFCEFYDQSFMVNTIERLQPFGVPYLLTVKNMEALSYRTLKQLNISSENAIYEPLAKNTGPAVALMCHILNQKGLGDEVVGFFPADHLIIDKKAFQKAVALGEQCAKKGEIVTLGIKPNYASTGYGYIELSDSVEAELDGLSAFRATRFLEKPDKENANQFLQSGKHFWNAGMFIFKVSVMVEMFEKHLPEVWGKISQIKEDLSDAKYHYANCESISFDYGIMEKLDQCVCIPSDMGWSDVGSWDEIARLSEEVPDLKSDSHARVFTEEAHGNYVYTVNNKAVGLVGVHDLIVVDTPDATLVARKGDTQKVRELVKQIKSLGMPQASEHIFEKRHWGGFEVLSDDSQYKAKKITVDPGAQLSLQSHTKRQEHWVVIEGQGEVTLDDDIHKLGPGESVMIPLGAKHRMKNPGDLPLVFVEVQTGSYFGEDDIVRYQDDYNRT